MQYKTCDKHDYYQLGVNSGWVIFLTLIVH